MGDGRISHVQDLLELIEKSKLGERRDAHVRLWFRGQTKAAWELVPGVYRSTFPERDEEKRLRIERHLNQDFRVQSAGLTTGGRDDCDLYFLQQHYRLPTRLLDWTTSPLAALYFAVSKDQNGDGTLYMMDAYRLALCQRAEKSFQGIATSRNAIFCKALRAIVAWENPKLCFPQFILPVRPDQFDPRMALQKSCFTFHTPGHDRLTKATNDSLLSFFIPRAAKNNILREPFSLGIDAFAIYGDLESLSERLKYAYKVG